MPGTRTVCSDTSVLLSTHVPSTVYLEPAVGPIPLHAVRSPTLNGGARPAYYVGYASLRSTLWTPADPADAAFPRLHPGGGRRELGGWERRWESSMDDGLYVPGSHPDKAVRERGRERESYNAHRYSCVCKKCELAPGEAPTHSNEANYGRY